MINKEDLKDAILKVLSKMDKKELGIYLDSISDDLLYEIYAVYYLGQSGEIELGSVEEDFKYCLNCSKQQTPGVISGKIMDNPLLCPVLREGMDLLDL